MVKKVAQPSLAQAWDTKHTHCGEQLQQKAAGREGWWARAVTRKPFDRCSEQSTIRSDEEALQKRKPLQVHNRSQQQRS